MDPFPKGRLGFSIPRLVARREVGQVGNGRVIWLRLPGEAAARMEMMREQPPRRLHIRRQRTQTFEMLRVEWEAWAPVVASGGVIALHDTRPGPEGTAEQTSVAYARTVVRADARFAVVDEVDTLHGPQRLPG